MMNTKITKYFIYAIGEILLVIVGILIALQINNNNELKKERAFEVKMLNEIRSALEQDKSFFENHLIGFRTKVQKESFKFFERMMVNEDYTNDSINYYFNTLYYGIQVTLNRGPYEALKTTGLDKVTNDSLRNELINVYDFIYPRYSGLIEGNDENVEEEMMKLMDILREDGSMEIDGESLKFIRGGIKDIDFKSNQDWRNLLALSKFNTIGREDRLQSVIPYMENLIKSIENEISMN